MSDPTLSRQLLLPEIGEAGQARIGAASFEVTGSDGAIIEAEYLHRAGAERLELLPGREALAFRHERWFRFAASRRVGAGAWRALVKLRTVLGMEAS